MLTVWDDVSTAAKFGFPPVLGFAIFGLQSLRWPGRQESPLSTTRSVSPRVGINTVCFSWSMAIWRPVIMLAKGLLRASGKAAIDTCGGGLVRQPVTLVALQVEPSKIVTFIVKRFTTKTVFVSKRTPMATGESRTGTIALGAQSVVS